MFSEDYLENHRVTDLDEVEKLASNNDGVCVVARDFETEFVYAFNSYDDAISHVDPTIWDYFFTDEKENFPVENYFNN